MSTNVADIRAAVAATREIMADPERVVLDAGHLYEEADGSPYEGSWTGIVSGEIEPPRMCFYGALRYVTRDSDRLLREAHEALVLCDGPRRTLTKVLEDDREACVALCDRYLAATDD